jgi:hypothetical protein
MQLGRIPLLERSQIQTAAPPFDAEFERSTVYLASEGRYGERTTMGILRIDRRREQRTSTDITLLVWGIDTHGERFLQEAHARDISLSGALLSGLETDIRSGDVIGVLCGKRKARFRVVWVRYDDTGDKMLVAVQRLAADACPWPELLNEASESTPTATDPSADSPTP